jgi:DNA transformation protein and related proteins
MPRKITLYSELEALRNLGPKSAAWLAAVGLTSREDLVRTGAVGACRLLREAGCPVTRVMAYAIEGALMDCDWWKIPMSFRQQIARDFDILKRTRKKA